MCLIKKKNIKSIIISLKLFKAQDFMHVLYVTCLHNISKKKQSNLIKKSYQNNSVPLVQCKYLSTCSLPKLITIAYGFYSLICGTEKRLSIISS